MDILRSPDGSITFQTMVSVTVPAGTSMLEAENLLMDKINEAETSLTAQLLEVRDASAQPSSATDAASPPSTNRKSAMWKEPESA